MRISDWSSDVCSSDPEARERSVGRNDPGCDGGEQGQERHEVVAQPAPDEHRHHAYDDREGEALVERHRAPVAGWAMASGQTGSTPLLVTSATVIHASTYLSGETVNSAARTVFRRPTRPIFRMEILCLWENNHHLPITPEPPMGRLAVGRDERRGARNPATPIKHHKDRKSTRLNSSH